MIHAKWNKEHNERAETLFLPADESLTAVSSTEARKRIESGELDRLEGVLDIKALKYIKNKL
jgi:phosphopantetheine adenylyltransferase